MDGTIPRRFLPEVLRRTAELSEEYGLPVANVFHAGDGNLHPLILYNANNPGELERTGSWAARSGTVRRSRRDHHRRARGRDREDPPDVRAIQQGRAGPVPRREACLRSDGAAQPRQGGSDPTALLGVPAVAERQAYPRASPLTPAQARGHRHLPSPAPWPPAAPVRAHLRQRAAVCVLLLAPPWLWCCPMWRWWDRSFPPRPGGSRLAGGCGQGLLCLLKTHAH